MVGGRSARQPGSATPSLADLLALAGNQLATGSRPRAVQLFRRAESKAGRRGGAPTDPPRARLHTLRASPLMCNMVKATCGIIDPRRQNVDRRRLVKQTGHRWHWRAPVSSACMPMFDRLEGRVGEKDERS
jgi:hypothetical protein